MRQATLSPPFSPLTVIALSVMITMSPRGLTLRYLTATRSAPRGWSACPAVSKDVSHSDVVEAHATVFSKHVQYQTRRVGEAFQLQGSLSVTKLKRTEMRWLIYSNL